MAIQAKNAAPSGNCGLMKVTFRGSGLSTTTRSRGIVSVMTGPSSPTSRGVVPARVLRLEDHGLDILEAST